MTVFLRIGSDYQNNYYEYEIPLKLTHLGDYSSGEAEKKFGGRKYVRFSLHLLTQVKTNRNKEKNKGGSASFTKKLSSQTLLNEK